MPQDLLDRIDALEREVRQLRGRAQIRPALDQILNGDVTIGEGGVLRVLAPDGTGLFGVGEFGPFYDHTDGTPQQGVIMQREDGSTAFTIRAVPSALGVDDQPVIMWDRTGHGVLTDDATSGRGLGSPALPLPFQKLPPGGEVITGSSFENCWFATVQRMNPVAAVLLEFGAAPGSKCEVRVQYRPASEPDFTNIATDSVTAASSASGVQYKTSWYTFPLDRAEFEETVFIRIQAREVSGTDGVICNALGGVTRRTYSTAEVPEPPPGATLATFAARTATAPDSTASGEGVDVPIPPPPWPDAPATAEPEQEPTPARPPGVYRVDD
ncbi:hypothetical protein RI578_22670 [Streptomyces sp. BB1-1-1]|uniref:hypothetical protein n=1 Tax=Streptomyces sp. BB1-1-1 TaxID=3074430 RepID=UPI0028772D9A|nr:hypothetical protein [Streptomyces sp. BB1-1-1]WND36914.1 hypothetical protein RI578_22670 [Streptomyces sp. BB1-1-1]